MDAETSANLTTGVAWLIGIIVSVVLIAALVLGGWAAGWWFTTQDVQRQSNAIRLNYATQESDLNQVSSWISQIDGIKVQEDGVSGLQLADLKAQALGIGNQLCALVPQISIPLGSDASWVRTNCSAGAVSLTSPLRKG